jgi:hypothetical protein
MTKLGPGDVSDIQRRNLPLLAVLLVVTLGFYWFYLGYQWSKEVNGIVGRVKYPPIPFLIINIVTLGLAGLIYECLWAYDIAFAAQAHAVPGQTANLPVWIIGLNSVGMLLSLTVIGVFVGFPLGVCASIMIQSELNKLAAVLPELKPSPV